MEKENLIYLRDAIDFAMTKGEFDNKETSYNTLANAASIVDDEINALKSLSGNSDKENQKVSNSTGYKSVDMDAADNFITNYFSMDQLSTKEETKINTDFGQVMNILVVYHESVMKKTTKEWFLNDARIGLYEVKKELPTDERKQLVDFYLKTCNKTISIEYAGGIVDEYLQSETVEVKEENNLLKKYMMHVLAYESADYVTEINTDFNKLTEHVPVLFTIEEKDELSAISAESHKELGYT